MKRHTSFGFLLILFGSLALWGSVRWLPHWGEAAPRFRTHLVLFLAAGVPLVLSGAAFLAGRLVGLAGWVGGLASAICGINLLAGIARGSIPCAGPT